MVKVFIEKWEDLKAFLIVGTKPTAFIIQKTGKIKQMEIVK